jgi:hypothetical protein
LIGQSFVLATEKVARVKPELDETPPFIIARLDRAILCAGDGKVAWVKPGHDETPTSSLPGLTRQSFVLAAGKGCPGQART